MTKFNERQKATVLAALRFWQRMGHECEFSEHSIATNDESIVQLSNSEIDSLCEEINSANASWFIVEHSGMANEGPDGRSDPYDTFEEAYRAMKDAYTKEEIEEWPVKIAVDRGDGVLMYDF